MPDIYEYGIEDLDEPMSDTQVSERLGRSIPYWRDFSTDAFLAMDPRLRPILADAFVEGEGDPLAVYAALNDQTYQRQLMRSLTGGGYGNGGQTWRELHDMGKGNYADRVRDRGNAMLENVFAASAPTASRNIGLVDMLSERYGGRPYPGAGAGIPAYAGPGFEGGGAGPFAPEFPAPMPDAPPEVLQAYEVVRRNAGKVPGAADRGAVRRPAPRERRGGESRRSSGRRPNANRVLRKHWRR